MEKPLWPSTHLGNPLARRIAVALLLAFMLAVTLPTLERETPTMDEPIHLYSGYVYLRTGNLSINVEHPPWFKELAALPLLFRDVNLVGCPADRLDLQTDFATRFLYLSGNSPDALILTGRVMMVLIMLAAALILYAFAGRLFGSQVGLLVLFLAAVSPVLLAYGRLVTPDTACAAAMLLTLMCYWEYLRSPRPRRLLACGISLAFALMTQSTSFTLLLTMPVLAVAQARRQRRGGAGGGLARHLGACAAMLVVAVLCIGVFYGVHTSRMTQDQIEKTIDFNIPANSLGRSLIKGLSKVSPPLAMYATSFMRNYYFNRKGHAIYLNGKVKQGPFWYYYPEAFLLKTPLGVLILLALATAFFPWRRMRLNDLFVVVPIVFLIVFTATIRIQFGIKYLIPLYAFLYIFIARGTARMLSVARKGRLRMPAVGLVASLLLYSTFSLLSGFPHLIPYFNESIGSRDNGYRYLAAHNVDWGQDIKSLASFVESNGITSMQTALFEVGLYITGDRKWRISDYYMPNCELSRFDLNKGRLKEGWFALSTSTRKDIILRYPELAAHLDALAPRAIINHSILVYYLEEGWKPR